MRYTDVFFASREVDFLRTPALSFSSIPFKQNLRTVPLTVSTIRMNLLCDVTDVRAEKSTALVGTPKKIKSQTKTFAMLVFFTETCNKFAKLEQRQPLL